jgi:hypothetical protein
MKRADRSRAGARCNSSGSPTCPVLEGSTGEKAPTLKAGDIFIMDNLSAYKVSACVKPSKQQSARLLYVPKGWMCRLSDRLVDYS